MGENPQQSADLPVGGLVPEHLDRKECLELISSGGVGRVAFDDGEGPAVIPVNYAMDGEAVVFRTSVSGRLNRSLESVVAGGEVRTAFEVDHIDEATHEGWSVLVRGGAHRLSETEKAATAGVESWAAGDRGAWFRVFPHEISGRRLRRTG